MSLLYMFSTHHTHGSQAVKGKTAAFRRCEQRSEARARLTGHGNPPSREARPGNRQVREKALSAREGAEKTGRTDYD